jgi:hypothetical protein
MSEVERYAIAPGADDQEKAMVKALVGMKVLVKIGEIGEYTTDEDLENLHVGSGPFRLFELSDEQNQALEEGQPMEDKPAKGYSEWREPDAGAGNGYVMSVPPGQYYFIPVDR